VASGEWRMEEERRPTLESVAQPPSAAIWAVGRRPRPNDRRGRLPHISRRSVSRASLIIFGSILLGGCKPAPPPAPPTVTDSTERGPIRFSAEVSPKNAWIGDPITIALSAATPEDLVVRFPATEELGEVNVRSVGEVESRPAEAGTTWKRSYVIDTLTAGTLEIPPQG
jgi:hypothetical protein